MSAPSATPLLDRLSQPSELKALSDSQLAQLADELRHETIAAVSQTGGHLGAGLGVVELTVALHAVFDAPRDKIIWDVGHQSYPHKILTGRRAQMAQLRQQGGLSGFTKRAESPYDPFGAGHSSTSISAAGGFAAARGFGAEVGDTIAVIGDGALSGGMAFEALNHAGHLQNRMIVVLNDNERSIDPPVGALGKHLAQGTAGAAFFNELGFDYIGPVDGHDMALLLAVLREVKASAKGPVLIHARTRKGKGYAPAESRPDGGHATAKFDVVTGAQSKIASNAPSYTEVFADALIAQAAQDARIIGVTAAMPEGTGLNAFGAVFPDRVFDVGIAEQHAVTFSAALAAAGMKPFCAIYSTFLQRGYDQIVHDVAIQKLPVRFAIDRAGLVGADGATHAGAFDTAFLANLPDFVVMAASDEAELMRMVATAAAIDDRPSAFRYPRGEARGVERPAQAEPLEIGRGRIVQEGAQLAILSYGARLGEVLKASELLRAQGIVVTVADARFCKPLDQELILQLVAGHDALLTIEEGAIGGFASHVQDFLTQAGVFDRGYRFRSMVLPDSFIQQASPAQMYEAAGMDAARIAQKVRQMLDR